MILSGLVPSFLLFIIPTIPCAIPSSPHLVVMNEGLADVFQDELPTDSLDEMQYFAERMSHLGTQNTAEWTAISGAIGQDGIGALKVGVD